MDEMVKSAPVPASFWVVSGLSLLWNAFGGYDYAMTQLRVPTYLAQFPPDMMARIDAMPIWATACWAIGVWGSVAGSLLLLVRSRHAGMAFALSLAGAVVSVGWQFVDGMPPSPVMAAVILSGIALFWWYARRAASRGWLR